MIQQTIKCLKEVIFRPFVVYIGANAYFSHVNDKFEIRYLKILDNRICISNISVLQNGNI